MEELQDLLSSLTFRDLTKPTIQLIIRTIDNNDIDDDDVDNEIKRFAKTVKKSYILVDDKIFGEERKKEEFLANSEQKAPDSDIYTQEDMNTPWNIVQDMGYNIYQDNSSQKDLFWLKSISRKGDEKTIDIKTTKDSLINLLNSWAGEKKTMWNKPIKDTQGNVSGFNETLVDFKEADLTRFFHKQIVFDPTNTSNLCEFRKKECLNSYTAPKLLHITGKETQEIPEILENFYLLIYNITGNDEEATEYVLQWLSRNYQTKQKAETLMLFSGESGTGKGVLVEILSELYGERHIGRGTAKSSIFSKEENASLKDVLYYHADEVVIDGENWSAVKALTGTNHTFVLKELYANSRTYPNWANFIFNVNTHKGDLPFKIPEQKDRRICCFETFTPLKDLDWWDDGRNGTHSSFFTDEFITALAKFLGTYTYSETLLERPYQNSLRYRMIKAGQSSVSGFALALMTKDFDWLDDNGLDTIVWYNNGGEQSKGYDWNTHLDKCYAQGYITLKDAKTLFTQLFPSAVYKSSQMKAEGMIEKNKQIPMGNDKMLKSTRYFELPHDVRYIKKSIKEKLRGDK